MILRINVSKGDIEHGLMGNCWKCPVARAIYRKLDLIGTVDNLRVRVYPAYVFLYDANNDKHDLSLPNGVGEKIEEFDDCGKMKPFSFWLNIADEVYNLIKGN